MEKLIELLNEYDGEPTEWKQIGDKIYFDGLGGNSELHELIIISKYYGFIQWLVDNDKIELKAGPLYGFQPIMNNRQPFTLYETLLMLLSISDTPIEDLVSLLK